MPACKLGQLWRRQTLCSDVSAFLWRRADARAGSGDCSGAQAVGGPAPGSCRSPLGAATAAGCHRRSLGAAVGCSWHGASLPPCCFSSEHHSAGMALLLTTSVAEVANFGRGQGRELGGAFMVGAFFDGGTVFQRQSKPYTGLLRFISHL